MRIEGRHEFAVARERLWAALVDPALLARVLPGCDPLEPAGENRWKAAMTVAIGPVKGKFVGTLALSELVPPSSYRMKVDGTGPSGFLKGDGAIELHETATGAALDYRMDAQVGGRIASVGQRLVESSGRALAKQGLEGLERELAAGSAESNFAPAASGETPVAAARPATAPSTAAFAGRFAVGLWRELPASWRWLLVAAGVAVLALLLFLLAD